MECWITNPTLHALPLQLRQFNCYFGNQFAPNNEELLQVNGQFPVPKKVKERFFKQDDGEGHDLTDMFSRLTNSYRTGAGRNQRYQLFTN
jgi:hypothetical protein